MTALAFEDFSLRIAGRLILDRITLEIAPGEVLALVGESGAGKTMLLRAANGDLPEGAEVSGRILFGGSGAARTGVPSP